MMGLKYFKFMYLQLQVEPFIYAMINFYVKYSRTYLNMGVIIHYM